MKPIYEQYDFENLYQFFEYIIESKINGQPTQVKKLIKEMKPAEVKEFIAYLDTEYPDNGVTERYCRDAAIYILGEKSTANALYVLPVNPGQKPITLSFFLFKNSLVAS